MRGEGQAMLLAVLDALSDVPDCRVASTWDARWPVPQMEFVDWHLITQGPRQESDLFCQLASESEISLIIAPESNGILSDRCRLVEVSGGKLAGPSSLAVATCSDKLLVCDLLTQHGIPTPPTTPLMEGVEPLDSFPLLIKPRDGAGSQHTRLITNQQDWNACQHDVQQGVLPAMIQQVFQPGIPRSVALLVDAAESTVQFWPACDQRFSHDGHFEFLGGRIDSASALSPSLCQDLSKLCRCLSGLQGYIGVDLICPSDGARPWVVDINPRLTTSFLGYQRLTADNLGEWLIGHNGDRHVRWSGRTVEFGSSNTAHDASVIVCS